MRNLWTESDKAMITEDGNVRRYIGSDIIDVFEGGGDGRYLLPKRI